MGGFPGDSPELEEAFDKLKDADGAEEEREAAREALRRSLDHGADIQQIAVELVNEHTRFNKTTAKEMRKEEKEKEYAVDWGVKGVRKEVPDAPDVDEYTYHFFVDVAGEESVISVPESEMHSQHTFRQQLLRSTDFLSRWDEWVDWVNNVLQEHKPIEEIEEDPLRSEHMVVTRVVNRIGGLEYTTDVTEFKAQPSSRALYHPDEGILDVSNNTLQDVMESTSGETNWNRLRGILDSRGLLADTTKQINISKGFFMAWRFDADRLEKEDVVGDLSGLVDNEEGE